VSKIGGSGIAREEIKTPFSFSDDWQVILPLAALSLSLALHLILPAYADYRLKLLPHFAGFLEILMVIYGIAAVTSFFSRRMREKLVFKAAFHVCAFAALPCPFPPPKCYEKWALKFVGIKNKKMGKNNGIKYHCKKIQEERQ
jgi:hypothetical protein